MTTAEVAKRVPFLVNGQRLTQPEFHERYQAARPGEKWELIGGIVYMASPLRFPHGHYEARIGCVLTLYELSTPGVMSAHNATTILGPESEPQPDLSLHLSAALGGQARQNEAEYLVGPPELVGEIAYSSQDIDLHRKREDYEQAGVKEYMVLSIEDEELHWFDFVSGRPIRANREGVFRSRVFPGLWIDPDALIAPDGGRLLQVAQQGLASPEHARFVKRLQARRPGINS